MDTDESKQSELVENDDIKVEDIENGNSAETSESKQNTASDTSEKQDETDRTSESGDHEKSASKTNDLETSTSGDQETRAPEELQEMKDEQKVNKDEFTSSWESTNSQETLRDIDTQMILGPPRGQSMASARLKPFDPDSDSQVEDKLEDSSQNKAGTSSQNGEKQDGHETPRDVDTQNVTSVRAKSTTSIRTNTTEPELQSTKSREPSRQPSANSDPDNNRMYSPDDDLSDKEFLLRLQQDNLRLSKELFQWRDSYDVKLSESETSRIMDGKPTLEGMGLNEEEEEIAGTVVQGKLQELDKMTLEELVDFVRLESF